LELWGSHGLEHRSASGSPAAPTPNENEGFLAREAAWIADRGWDKVLERKPFGLALHGRAFPAAFQAARRAVLPRWSAAADGRNLEIRAFDGGMELRPRGAHKGQVVERVLEDVGPLAPVASLGDDATDEDAFEAIRGRGLGVLVRHESRPTLADVWIRPPTELADFLEAWSSADGGALA
ncbi:MAG: trehalose-phosphatase, partial [Thermoanaerobaculia bacterium]